MRLLAGYRNRHALAANDRRRSRAKGNTLQSEVNHDDAFRLSRVEAEGWNKAQSVMTDDALLANEGRVLPLNPYLTDPERARWRTGFTNALVAGECR